MHTVLIHPARYHTCRHAVDRVFDLFPLAMTGKKVLIKPNALRPSNPEEGIVTHPAMLRAVVDRVEAARPASIIVGDNPGIKGYGANRKTFHYCGLLEASKGYYRNIGSDVVEVPFNSKFCDTVTISSAILEADIIISLPKFKTHGLVTISGAIKNCYGYLPGALKAQLHACAGDPVRFSELLVDVFCLRVPDLFIVDAVLGMQGNGPASKDLRHIGKVIGSNNAVAVDAVIARMMGVEPHTVHHLQVAQMQGLGTLEEQSTEIIGDSQPLADFRLPPIMIKAGHIPSKEKVMLESAMMLRPTVNKALCTGCGTCVDNCPGMALAMKDDVPRVEPDICITCFCCQEMCPEAAITLR